MKNKDIYREIGAVEDKYILEADPALERQKAKKGIVWRKTALIAACISIALIIAVFAFIMPLVRAGGGDDVIIDRNNLPAVLKDYADSEYLDLMLAIYKYDKSSMEPTKRPVNFFDDLLDFLYGAGGNVDAEGGVNSPTYEGIQPPPTDESPEFDGSIAIKPEADGTGSNDKYQETTDNQVSGVIEADLFKRSDKYIFYLNITEQVVHAYSIAGEESECKGIFKLSFFEETKDEGYGNVSGLQMYLSEDCKILTVYGNRYGNYISNTDGKKYIISDLTVLSIDVSDPANMKLKNQVSVKGNCLSSRLVDGKLLLMTRYYIGNIDYADESTFLPQIDCGEGYESIDADDIIFPETLTGRMYTVVIQMDEDTLKIDGVAAFLSYSDTVYVSADKIFITRGYNKNTECEIDGKNTVENKAVTDIYALGYGEGGFEKLGGISVDGRVKNQYSLDEYNGIFRVVTTTNSRIYYNAKLKDGVIEYSGSLGQLSTNAALFCIDIESWQIVGEVRDFAPVGETVESVRFDGDHAYVCTAVVVTFTDPVYFFDLSDMSNITYTDTGVIEGYSSSLVNFGDGFLLGIGFGDNREILKIEIYAENNGKVESVCAYERQWVGFSQDYKSYFIDRENGIVGLAISDYQYGSNEYILLSFNGYELTDILDESFVKGLDWLDPNYTRATLIDGYFYILCNSDFKVIKIN